MTQPKISSEMAEVLRFRVPPWFDPVPWFVWERLDQERVLALARVQMQLQRSILLAQQRALNEAIKILG